MIDEAKIFKAVINLRNIIKPVSLKIIEELTTNRYLSVTDLYKKLDVGQSQVSQHLALLRNAKVVSFRKDGVVKNYSLNKTYIAKMHDVLKDLFG